MSLLNRRIAVAFSCLLWLAGCETTSLTSSNVFAEKSPNNAGPQPFNFFSHLSSSTENDPEQPPLNPSDPQDDVSLGKQHYRQGNYGRAEQHFRKAVESGPNNAEAWLGLAASYDRLRRFDLADRAYGQVIRITGETAEVMNNQGYSYMLRGDNNRARKILLAAQAKDPANPYIKTNLALLSESVRNHQAVR